MLRRDHDIALMLAYEAYEALPEAEKYVGQGRFGSVKKVKRVSDSLVSIIRSFHFSCRVSACLCCVRLRSKSLG